MKGESIMAPAVQGPLALSRATRPTLTIAAALMLAVPAGGCWQSPRMQAPFTLSNPSERHPIKVSQGEALLDLSVSSRSSGLSSAQWDQLYRYLAGYQEAGRGGLTIKTPSGSANQAAAKRAYDDVRHAMRRAGISARGVRVEPYFAKYDPAAPIRLSYLELVAKGPDCPDWSENVGRDPQNLPWPNMGCATQKNLAAMVADPEDFVAPHPEMPRPSERRDVVWGKYVKGEVTGAKWAPNDRPLSERANSTDVEAGSGD
jgi:pilus assembly protein CpaD